jgi:GxxExxY protein
MTEIIHKELSYKVRGTLFDVYNELGPMLAEKFYSDAISIGLESKGIACETEKQFSITYHGVEVGRYFVDVWIEAGKLLLEVKVAPQILPIHKAQAISYLKVTNADLASVVNFGAASLEDERLPNRLREQTAVFNWSASPPPINTPFPELINQLVKLLHIVHFELGPGFFHHVYRRAAMVELREQEINYEFLKQTPIYYHGIHLGNQESRLILVEGCLLLATVAVNQIDEAIKTNLRVRLKRQNITIGLLANFKSTKLEIVIIRKDPIK